MTLILSAATANFVAQSGDRRVTRTTLNPVTGRITRHEFEIAENKQVIMLGRDGVATFGYTGPAYHVRGVTTDTWIAHVLFGAPVDPLGPLGDVRESSLKLTEAIRLLSERLAHEGNPGLTVVAAGWLTQRGTAARPFIRVIDDHSVVRTPNRVKRRVLPPYARLVSAGASVERRRLRARELGLAMFDGRRDYERIFESLTNETSSVAEVVSSVGSDCLVVIIPNPDKHPRVIRTAHVTRGKARVKLSQGSVVIEEPVTFTPWIVGGNIAVPPYCHNLSRVLTVGSYALVPKAPPGEPGPLRIVSVPHIRNESFRPAR